jgi:hypothetical protein
MTENISIFLITCYFIINSQLFLFVRVMKGQDVFPIVTACGEQMNI